MQMERASAGCQLHLDHQRRGNGAGSTVTRVGKYDAKGASDAESLKVIDGVCELGLKALTAN
jgi:hypothetical protein